MTDAQIADGRDALRDELVNQQRDRFFMAYMAKAKTALKIEVRQDVLAQVMGPMPAPPVVPGPGPRRAAVAARFSRAPRGWRAANTSLKAARKRVMSSSVPTETRLCCVIGGTGQRGIRIDGRPIIRPR